MNEYVVNYFDIHCPRWPINYFENSIYYFLFTDTTASKYYDNFYRFILSQKIIMHPQN